MIDMSKPNFYALYIEGNDEYPLENYFEGESPVIGDVIDLVCVRRDTNSCYMKWRVRE